MKLATLAVALLVASLAMAAVQLRGTEVAVTMPRYAATLSADNGALLSLAEAGKPRSIVTSGSEGLWHARFADGSTLDAAAFHAGAGERTCVVRLDEAAGAVAWTYTSAELSVVVRLLPTPSGLELRATVTPGQKTLLDFALPGRLRFSPAQLQRFIAPMSSGQSVGIACNARFFSEQPQDQPSGWRGEPSGPTGYVSLYGDPLDQRADRDPAVALTVTPDGKQWLGEALAQQLAAAQATVNRPPTRAQADLTLVDSANGPYLSANHLGGKGHLWRLGGSVGEGEKENALVMVGAVMDRLVQTAPPERTKLGLIALRRGPEAGGWSDVTIEAWRARLTQAARLSGGKVKLVLLTTPGEMLAAAKATDFCAILNPYGESAPVTEEGGMAATTAAVGQFVRGGGSWFEVGGYPFFYALRPLRYLRMTQGYPPAFADFFHLDTTAGAAAIYRMQPQTAAPWEGARNPEAIFIPGRLTFGGDEQGGYCDRAFGTYVQAGKTWQAPAVRLAVGNAVGADLAAYCQANAITRRLPDKLDPATLAKLRQSVLVYYRGSAREKTAALSLLPQPTLIHFADYLHGGFDKQYPDHLPPSAMFGTPEEMKTFFAQARTAGHLVMPYTNPTWWCDHPKGPTFEREGEAPLLKGLNGKPIYERYVANDGWTVCHWHPAVQAANRKTVRQFTDEYPVDVLFQDQCGARGWGYDLNPASPTPYAYADGLISMVAEDCRTKPLSTEGGWDRVVNYESQLCGMTWSIVTTENGPAWIRGLETEYPPNTWTVFPLAEYIAHDKTIMVHHDLGQFVTSRPMLSWTLGLGFGLSYRTSAAELAREPRRQWLLWLDRLQKSVCARYIGEPVTAFEQVRGAGGSAGQIHATYGPVTLTANLGAEPVGGAKVPHLSPYGFIANAPGMIAASLQAVDGVDAGPDGVSFVAEGDAKSGDLWVYAPPQQAVTVKAPPDMQGPVRVTLDGQATVKTEVTNGALALTTPAREGVKRVLPPAELAGKAPRQWPGAKPAIGVIDLGPGVGLTWTKISPAAWVTALEQSPLARASGRAVRRLGGYAEVQAALVAGPTAWLGIINPYGESFPAAGPGKWREALQAVRDYVNHGGVWWETGGYSFYRAVYPTVNGWEGDATGPGGMGFLGLSVGGGEVNQPAEALQVTATGRAWLGAEVAARVEAKEAVVNRAVPHGSEDAAHVTLVGAGDQDYVAGTRLEGWGWLWRAGGMTPDEGFLPAVVAQTLSHIYDNPPEPVGGGTTCALWHAKLQAP